MLITGIVGYPLKSTLSPTLHHAAFRSSGIHGVYIALPVKPEHLKETMLRVRHKNFRGVNITIPHKETVLEFIDATSTEVNAIQAANTIVVEENQLVAYNTDSYGFQKSLKEYKINITNMNVLIIGAGGVGRACAHVISSMKPRRFYIANRHYKRAKEVAALFGAEPVAVSQLNNLVRNGMHLVVNATSIDLHKDMLPLLKDRAIYYDVNYRFRYKNNSALIINGLLMLVLQAARSFFLWTNCVAPVETMKLAAGLPVVNHYGQADNTQVVNDLRMLCSSVQKSFLFK